MPAKPKARSRKSSARDDSPPKKLRPLPSQRQFLVPSFLPPAQPFASTSRQKSPSAPAPSSSPGLLDESVELTSSGARESGGGTQTRSSDVKGKGKLEPIIIDDSDEDTVSDEENVGRDDVLWVDKYGPLSEEGLAVHKKKINDVRQWLIESLENERLSKYRRVLVLSGPAGSAKTATIRVLSKEMDFEIVEYRNSGGIKYAGDGLEQDLVSRSFPDFLAQATMTPTLTFVPANTSSATMSASLNTLDQTRPQSGPRKKKIILLEDLPNIFTSSLTRSLFQSSLSSFASTSRFRPGQTYPLVIIVSEAIVRPSNFDGDNGGFGGGSGRGGSWEGSVSARSVVPLEVLNGPTCREIKFNPINNTLLRKFLNNVVELEFSPLSSSFRNSKRRLRSRPSPKAVELVIANSNGDIRSALNSLQFLSTNGLENGSFTSVASQEVSGRGKKRKSDGGKGKEKERAEAEIKQLLQFVTAREASLFLFHALGKVLYSKRWGEDLEDDVKDTRPKPPVTDPLPDHLRTFDKRLSKVDPNALFDDAPVDANLFISYIHQNYTGFCKEIEECEGILDSMSASDALMRIEGDRLPNSQYSFQLAVRGTLMALPSPVPRRNQKQYKSEMWEKIRLTKERQDEAELFIAKEERGRLKDGLGGGYSLIGSRKAALVELIPYRGLILSSRSGALSSHPMPPIIQTLTSFPPVPRGGFGAGTSALTKGEALDDRDAGEEDLEVVSGAIGDDLASPGKVVEVAESEWERLDGPASGAVDDEERMEKEVLYLEEDDIAEWSD